MLDGPGHWASWPGSSLPRPSQLSGNPEPLPGAPHVLSREKAGLNSHPRQRLWQVLLLQTELRREGDNVRAGAEKEPLDHTCLHQEADRALRQNQLGSMHPSLGSGPGPGAGGVRVGVCPSASVSCLDTHMHTPRWEGRAGPLLHRTGAETQPQTTKGSTRATPQVSGLHGPRGSGGTIRGP